MKIVFFNRFFLPDTSATSQIVSDLAIHLAAKGHEVHVVSSGAPGSPVEREDIRGVTVHRVATAPVGHHGLWRRALAYIRYYRGARGAARSLVEPGDIVVLKTDPPLLSMAVGPLAKRMGAKVVVWLQDVFPEVASEYGVPGMKGILGAALRNRRNRSLAIADSVVVICERMTMRLAESGCAGPFQVIHNWADGEAIMPLAPGKNILRSKWGLEDRIIVEYSGNLGRVHEFETIVGAARVLRDHPNIRFLFIGGGPRLRDLRLLVELDGLENVVFKPHQDRDVLSQSLAIGDLHLSVLQPAFEGLVHPSKLYGIMAAGRPTIFVGDTAGETASMLSRHDCGVSVSTGDCEQLARTILALSQNEMERARLGRNARRALDENYSMAIALHKWETLIESLSTPSLVAGTSPKT